MAKPSEYARLTAVECKLLTVPETAAMLRVSRRQIYRLRSLGELKFVKLGRATRVHVDSVHHFIARGGVP
ncbi:MAG: helix-turn-helix domain-containing protein [Phycisphaerales bacterium]